MTKEEIKRIIRANKKILEKYKVRSIALFGSHVRNEQCEESDIDFFVDFVEPSYDSLINLVFSQRNYLKRKQRLFLKGV